MFCFTEVVMLKDCVLKNRQSGLVGQIIFWTPPEKTLPQ
jgi:hypothetical protein